MVLRSFSKGRGSAATARSDTGEEQSLQAPNRTSLQPVASDFSSRYTNLKVRLHQQLLDVINLSALEKMGAEDIRREVGSTIVDLLKADVQTPLNLEQQNRIVSEVLDELTGLGPIEPLVKDTTTSDILVNTHGTVYVERNGKLELTEVRFKDDRHLMRIIDKIVSSVGRRVDESTPMMDARLKDGSRVNVIVPPLAVDGPILSIRKFATIRPSVEALIEIGSMTPEIAELLEAIIQAGLNVLISGGTGSGKTTLLNAISSFIPDTERIITIEDAAELQLQQPHVVRLETRPPNLEGKGEIAQRDLVRNSLRMRPDRIVVGEVRGAEAFDMLQAMNTGHDGSMTTIHANSCRDALSRLEQMIAMAGFDIPLRSMRAQIASALNVVIQLERMSDGRRYLVSFEEITGMEGDIITMQEIFQFKRTGMDEKGNVLGHFRATGLRPKFMEHLESRGITVPVEIFSPDREMN
ncbi:MAG: CpaF family protein [Proteobacteria bacterium]|nr:CpaF family protein [Pseudomonadota bacterium]